MTLIVEIKSVRLEVNPETEDKIVRSVALVGAETKRERKETTGTGINKMKGAVEREVTRMVKSTFVDQRIKVQAVVISGQKAMSIVSGVEINPSGRSENLDKINRGSNKMTGVRSYRNRLRQYGETLLANKKPMISSLLSCQTCRAT
jgi:hypothetical protein